MNKIIFSVAIMGTLTLSHAEGPIEGLKPSKSGRFTYGDGTYTYLSYQTDSWVRENGSTMDTVSSSCDTANAISLRNTLGIVSLAWSQFATDPDSVGFNIKPYCVINNLYQGDSATSKGSVAISPYALRGADVFGIDTVYTAVIDDTNPLEGYTSSKGGDDLSGTHVFSLPMCDAVIFRICKDTPTTVTGTSNHNLSIRFKAY